MKIAIPVEDGKLFGHFGHAPAFALIDADNATGAITGRQDLAAPPHEPGLLPAWLGEQGVELVMVQGMGRKALELLSGNGIAVVVGVPEDTPEALVAAHFAGTLETADNGCSHGHGDHHDHHHQH